VFSLNFTVILFPSKLIGCSLKACEAWSGFAVAAGILEQKDLPILLHIMGLKKALLESIRNKLFIFSFLLGLKILFEGDQQDDRLKEREP
jgi:hypothetical protein